MFQKNMFLPILLHALLLPAFSVFAQSPTRDEEATQKAYKMDVRYQKYLEMQRQKAKQKQKARRQAIDSHRSRFQRSPKKAVKASAKASADDYSSQRNTERQQRQLEEAQKKQRNRLEFEQGKKEMLTLLKGESGGKGLKFNGRERVLSLKSGKDPALAAGSPIGQELTEQAQIRRVLEEAKKSGKDPALAARSPIAQELKERAQIRRVLEEAKYSHMDSRELDLLAGQYPGNSEIQKKIQEIINSLKARQKVMFNLEEMADKYNVEKKFSTKKKRQAYREAKKAALHLADVWIPYANLVDEYLSQKRKDLVLGVGTEMGTGTLKEFIKKKNPVLLKKIVICEKAYHAYKAAEAAFAALDDRVDGAEATAYVKVIEASGVNTFDEWLGMRAKALDDSARLYRLIQKEHNK